MELRNNAARRTASALTVLAVSGALTIGAMPAEAMAAPTKTTSTKTTSTKPAHSTSTKTTAAAKPARPIKLGAVAGLAAAATKPAAAYRVSATWSPLTGAARYEVSLVDATGTVLAKARVTNPSWAGTTTLHALSRVTVKVVPLTSTGRRGRAASTSVVLPDLTAPTGAYTVSHDPGNEKQVTVTQTSLTDDVSAAAGITRAIDWDNGAGFQPWASGDSVSMALPDDGVYHAQVRLTDEAGNTGTVPVTITVNDHTGPQGTFSAGPATGWAKFTKVTVNQLSLSDDFSENEYLTRVIDWRDGSAPTTWAAEAVATHVYAAAGSYTPTVTITDEAGNATTVDTTAVTVTADTAAPVVKVRVPKKRVKYVASWRTVRGTARDGVGVGVAAVRVKVVEKRGTAWYAYRPVARTWFKAGPTKSAALRKAPVKVVAPAATGSWSVGIAGLRKGTLVLRAVGQDKVGNTSSPVVVSRSLTR